MENPQKKSNGNGRRVEQEGRERETPSSSCGMRRSLSLALSADDDVITNSSAYDLLTLRARPERQATRKACESGRDAGSSGRVYGPRCAMAGSPEPPPSPPEQDVPSDRPTSTTAKRKRERESGNAGTFLFCERDYGISEPHSLLPLSLSSVRGRRCV